MNVHLFRAHWDSFHVKFREHTHPHTEISLCACSSGWPRSDWFGCRTGNSLRFIPVFSSQALLQVSQTSLVDLPSSIIHDGHSHSDLCRQNDKSALIRRGDSSRQEQRLLMRGHAAIRIDRETLTSFPPVWAADLFQFNQYAESDVTVPQGYWTRTGF